MRSAASRARPDLSPTMPLVLISSPPQTQARAEREQATPASFAEMPPVRMQEVEPAVLLLQPPVAELGAERLVGKLWLTDRCVACAA